MAREAFSKENAFLFGPAVLSMCTERIFYLYERGNYKMIKRPGLIAIIALLMTALLLAGCADGTGKDDIESAGPPDEVLTIIWQGKETEIAISEIMGLDIVEMEAATIDSENNDSTRLVKGILLKDLLEQYLAVELSDIYSIRFTAGDGYAMEVPPEVIKERDIILAYEMYGEPLEEKKKPLRVVIPDERTMYWVGNLAKIDLIEDREIKEITGMVFIDSLVKVLEAQDYDYHGSIDKAVLAADLLMEFREKQEQDFITMLSSDGIEKKEEKEIFKNGYFKITGDGAPAFIDPELISGMWVKNIFTLFYGQTAYVSALQSIEMFENIKSDGNNGIYLDNIIEKTGLIQSDNYILRALDGYTIEISSENIGKGLIYIDERQQLNVYFKDLEDSCLIKDLLSIENKK